VRSYNVKIFCNAEIKSDINTRRMKKIQYGARLKSTLKLLVINETDIVDKIFILTLIHIGN